MPTSLSLARRARNLPTSLSLARRLVTYAERVLERAPFWGTDMHLNNRYLDIYITSTPNTSGIIPLRARARTLSDRGSHGEAQHWLEPNTQPQGTLVLDYRGTSLIRKRTPLGPYRRHKPRVVGGWAFSYERGTPVRPAGPGLGLVNFRVNPSTFGPRGADITPTPSTLSLPPHPACPKSR